MSTDRELLELAAKAIGLTIGPNPWRTPGINWAIGITWFEDSYSPGVHTLTGSDRDGPLSKVWNPGLDDGDCARMEAQLLIDVVWHEDKVDVDLRHTTLDNVIHFFKDYGGDKQAARRMASLRVAAEIGASMP